MNVLKLGFILLAFVAANNNFLGNNAQAQTPAQREICGNGVDDDANGQRDCADSTCADLCAKADALKAEAEADKKALEEAKAQRASLFLAAKKQVSDAEAALKVAEDGDDFGAIQAAKRKVSEAKQAVKDLGGKAKRTRTRNSKAKKAPKGGENWEDLPAPPNADEPPVLPAFLYSDVKEDAQDGNFFVSAPNDGMPTQVALEVGIEVLVQICPAKIKCIGYASEGKESDARDPKLASKFWNKELADLRAQRCERTVREWGGTAVVSRVAHAGNAGYTGRGVEVECASPTRETLKAEMASADDVFGGIGGTVLLTTDLFAYGLTGRIETGLVALQGSVSYEDQDHTVTSVKATFGGRPIPQLRIAGGLNGIFSHINGGTELELYQVGAVLEVGVYPFEHFALIGDFGPGLTVRADDVQRNMMGTVSGLLTF